MKPRDRTPQVFIDVPPLALRMYTNPSFHNADEDGQAVYGSHEAWLEARAEWASGHGMTLTEWWQQLLRETHARARTLAEINEPFSDHYLVEPDDWHDPRLTDPLLY